MKKKGLGILVFVGLIVFFALACQAQTKMLTILHTNDTHSVMVPLHAALWPSFRLGSENDNVDRAQGFIQGAFYGKGSHAGIARMAYLIKRIKKQKTNVLALHAGDVFVGTFEFNKFLGYPELKIMENLYDVMELGNHEFDLGIDTLAGILTGQLAQGPAVSLPVLCANFDASGTALNGLIQPYIIKTIGGIKVGVFGLVTQEPQNYSDEVNSRFPYRYEAPSPEQTLWYYAAQIAGHLKLEEKCDVVICLSHLGQNVDYILADNVPYIDVIVGGHSHDLIEKPILRNGKIIVQAGAFGEYLGELNLSVSNGAVQLVSYKLHELNDMVPEDVQTRLVVNQIRDGVMSDPRFGPVYTQTVGHALKNITKSWPEGSQNRDVPMGNLVADAYMHGLKKAGFEPDCSLAVLGYIGAEIAAGKIVGNDILRSVPYGYDPVSGLGFKVVIVYLPGSLLLGGLEYAAGTMDYTTDIAIQASGLTYTYDSSRPAAPLGQTPTRLNVMSVMINGEPVAANLEKPYAVAMNEQVFNFFNSMVGGALSEYKVDTGLFEYNLVRDYIKALKRVNYTSEGRIKDIKD
jgi:2',3'-cyclic-nucleotide 2'-phosphodiesterase (5'-nucleotidase family)